MEIDELKKFYLYLRKWERQNKEIIGKPIRTKHFIEDLGWIIHFFEEQGFSSGIIEMKRKYIPEKLSELFGVKEK